MDSCGTGQSNERDVASSRFGMVHQWNKDSSGKWLVQLLLSVSFASKIPHSFRLEYQHLLRRSFSCRHTSQNVKELHDFLFTTFPF